MASRGDNITKVPDVTDPRTKLVVNDDQVSSFIGKYLDSLPKKPTNAPVAGELFDFFAAVDEVLISRQNTEGVPEDKRVLFVAEDPPKAIDTIAITYMLASRVPGRFDQGPAGAGRIKEVRHHQRAIYDHPEHPGEKLVTMGKYYGNWIDFNIYAATDKVAMEKLIWFENVMSSFNWYFKLKGFVVVETGVGPRERVSIDEKQLTKYSLTYFVKTEDTYQYGTQELRSLIIQADVSNK